MPLDGIMEQKELLTKEQLFHHWNYYETLSRRLDETSRYVNQVSVIDSNNSVINNNATYSIEFEQIIVLTSIEFENVSKIICKKINPDFNVKWGNIVSISETILNKYPRIVETEVSTYFRRFKPLENWKVSKQINPDNPQKEKEIVEGLKWWTTYEDLKHQGYDVFFQANLENTMNAVASLLVINLYLQKIFAGNIDIASASINRYFTTNYTSKLIVTGESRLPDFGNKQAGVFDDVNNSIKFDTR